MHHGTHTHIVHLQNHNTHTYTYSTLNEMILVCVVCYSACNPASFPGHPQLPSSLLGMRQECIILSPIIIVCSCHKTSPSLTLCHILNLQMNPVCLVSWSQTLCHILNLEINPVCQVLWSQTLSHTEPADEPCLSGLMEPDILNLEMNPVCQVLWSQT